MMLCVCFIYVENLTNSSLVERLKATEDLNFYAEKIIANAGSFALAIILFFGIYEVTVIFGFT